MKQRRIYLEHIQFGSLFKLFFGGLMCVFILFALWGGLLAVISPSNVTINGNRAQTTLEALTFVPLSLFVGALFSAFFGAVGAALFRLAGKFIHFGELSYDEHKSKAITDNQTLENLENNSDVSQD